jgi:hypothetical protein
MNISRSTLYGDNTMLGGAIAAALHNYRLTSSRAKFVRVNSKPTWAILDANFARNPPTDFIVACKNAMAGGPAYESEALLRQDVAEFLTTSANAWQRDLRLSRLTAADENLYFLEVPKRQKPKPLELDRSSPMIRMLTAMCH